MKAKIHLVVPALGAVLLLSTAQAASLKNNILLIIADDYGADSSTLFNSTNSGARLAPTPNIDKLGHSGVLFPNFYARPSCSQSRACIFTGRESFRTGVGCAIGNTNTTPALRPSEYTLAKAFTTNAPQYSLASFGKWHLSSTADLTSPLTTGRWPHFPGYFGAGAGERRDPVPPGPGAESVVYLGGVQCAARADTQTSCQPPDRRGLHRPERSEERRVGKECRS